MDRRVLIITSMATAALGLGAFWLRWLPAAPPYPPAVPHNAPTVSDLLVFRAVLVHYALAGRALGLLHPPPERVNSMNREELAQLTGTILVLVREHTSVPLTEGDPSDPADRDLAARNRALGSVSLAALKVPDYLAFYRVSPGAADRKPLGTVTFSLPGYSDDRAVVRVDIAILVAADGWGIQVHLKREHGRWVVVGDRPTWIS